jgi:nitroimidazol reductase NimA-like FMN-containing flavoprotein (pyridoxamine 5'-phosphate oxidase superfamily)
MTSRGLEILSTDECLDLLRSRTLGRVAVQIGDAPAILPVNYALLDDEVVFRTDPGTKLSAALMRTMVAFEVDDADPVTHAAWSVLVVGYSEQVRDRANLARVDALGLEPWVTEGLDFVVHIRTRTISGRRLPAR